MWFSNANTIAASLCECSENVLENENIIRNNIELLQQKSDFLHEELTAKNDFIKSPFDIQTTYLYTLAICSTRQQTPTSCNKL